MVLQLAVQLPPEDEAQHVLVRRVLQQEEVAMRCQRVLEDRVGPEVGVEGARDLMRGAHGIGFGEIHREGGGIEGRRVVILIGDYHASGEVDEVGGGEGEDRELEQRETQLRCALADLRGGEEFV